MNITSDNESVHCLLIKGLLFLNKHNLILLEMVGGVMGDITKLDTVHPCDRYNKVLASFGHNNTGAVTGIAPTLNPMFGFIEG
jgi:hypothetical protein